MISIISAPDNLHPAYNPTYYYINSNNKSKTGFRYIVEIKEKNSGDLITRWTLKPRPVDGYGEIDISRALQIELDKKFNKDLDKWESNLEQILEYRVEFGEEYQFEWEYSDYSGANFVFDDGSPLGPPNFFFLFDNGTASVAPFNSGDVVRVIQDDPSVKPQLEGIFTVNDFFISATAGVNINPDTPVGSDINGFIVNNLIVSSGPTVGGKVIYADGRKSKFSNLVNVEKVAFRGAIPFLDFNNYDGENYDLDNLVDTTKLLTTHPDGFKVRKNNYLHVNTFDTDTTTDRYVYFEMNNGDLFRYKGVVGEIYKNFNGVPSNRNIEEYSVDGGLTWLPFVGNFNLYNYDSYDYWIFTETFISGLSPLEGIKFSSSGNLITKISDSDAAAWFSQDELQIGDSYNMDIIIAGNTFSIPTPLEILDINSDGIGNQLIEWDFEFNSPSDADVVIYPPLLEERISEKRNIKVFKECDRFEIIQLVFMDRLGSWLSFNFNKANYVNIEIDRLKGRRKYGDLSTDKWSYDTKEAGRNVYSVEENIIMTLNTTYLEEYEAQFFKELLTSPFVYMKVGDDTNDYINDGYWDDNYTIMNGEPFRKVNIVNTNYTLDKKRTRRGIIYSVDVEFSVNDNINI